MAHIRESEREGFRRIGYDLDEGGRVVQLTKAGHHTSKHGVPDESEMQHCGFDRYLDPSGRLWQKQADGAFEQVCDPVIEAEVRFVQRHLHKEAGAACLPGS